MASITYIQLLLLIIIYVKITQQEILDVKQFLHQNKYLNSTEVDKNSLKIAIQKFQNDSGLPMTGKLDRHTSNKMALPRCGKADHIQTNVIPQKDIWKKRGLTYKIRNYTEPFCSLQIKKLFDNAVDKWTKNLDLKIEESTSNQADIDIFFTKQDGPLERLGYAFFPEFGDIFIDQEEAWTLEKDSNRFANTSKLYLGWVLAHELGHALGLDHDEENIKSIMYPTYNTEQIEPSTEDMNNLVWLYGGTPSLVNNVLCSKTSIDALLHTNEKGHILIKGDQFWSFNKEHLLGGPFSLRAFYPGLPNQIDAAFSIRKYIYFFKDNIFYRYKTGATKCTTKLISKGFEKGPSNIDAAFYYPANTSFYFFKGDKYYIFNHSKKVGTRMVTEGMKISKDWSGVPDNIEAATVIGDDKALLIKNSKCYTVDLQSKKAEMEEDCTSNFYRCEN